MLGCYLLLGMWIELQQPLQHRKRACMDGDSRGAQLGKCELRQTPRANQSNLEYVSLVTASQTF